MVSSKSIFLIVKKSTEFEISLTVTSFSPFSSFSSDVFKNTAEDVLESREVHNKTLLFTKHYQQYFYFFSLQIQVSTHSTYNFLLTFTKYKSLKIFYPHNLHILLYI